MSSADVAVAVFRELEQEDLRVLQLIETGMTSREYVPKEQITKHSKLPKDRVDFELSRLDKLGLVYRMRGGYEGYTLNYSGYDCLAINSLVGADILAAFGKPLGVGKEADVFDALDPKGTRVAVKFHRLGRISFRQTRRKRGYMLDRAGWLLQSRLAAEKEYEALEKVYAKGVAVPQPIFHNRHVIVMGVIEGGMLSRYRVLKKPRAVFEEIMINVRKAFLEAGMVHGDLSDYNVIVKPDMHILIIDWPQSVPRSHPNAEELLERDVKNVLDYFVRKFRIKVSLKDAFEFVSGKTEKLGN